MLSEDELTIEALRRRVAELEVENAALAKAASDARQRYDLTVGGLLDHVAVYDAQWRFVYINEAGASLLGRTQEQLLGQCIWTLFPEAVGNQYYQELHQARATGETIRSEHFYAPMGRWFLNHIYPSHDGVCVFSTDVTERKRIEEEAKRSADRYRALVEATSLGIWTWRPETDEGDYAEVQRWWEELTGQSAEGQNHSGWLDSIYPDDREHVTRAWKQALGDGTRFEVEYRLCTQSGEVIHILSTAVPVFGSDDQIVEWVGAMRDVTSSRLAVSELNTVKGKLEAVVNASPLAITALTSDGRVQLWNPAAEKMFGWTEEEVLGWRLPIVQPGKEREFEANLAAVFSGLPLPVTETRRMRKNGELVDVGLWAAPMRGPDGEVEAALWIISDATERKRHERELAAAQESLSFAMRGARMGHWNRDLKTQVVYWSPELEEIFGLSTGEFAGHERDFFKFVHKDDVPVLADAVQESMRTGREYSVEFRFIRADGSMGWMDGRGRATLDEEGNATRIDGLGIDITDRKAAQASVQESERRFRFLSETLPVIAWSATADGTMDFINRRYYEYSGYDGSTPPAAAWALVVHPEDRPAAYEAYRAAIENGTTWQQEIRLRRRDGEFRWHLTRFEPVRDEYGTILRWFGTGTEIHDQKEAKAELEKRVQERTKELLVANAELEGFTYSVSHDLRAPLRAISATSTILMQELGDALDSNQKDLLVRQAHNAKRLGVLIDELLKLSRVGRQELVRSDFDLSALAGEIERELSGREWAGPIQFEIEPGMAANGDSRLVRFVLLNLMENACKFSPKGGVVRVGRYGNTFFVSDEGVGFDMAYSDKLFHAFERLVTEAEFPGTGIGLANAHRIVQRHGGRIWAQAQVGKGATFFFTLRSA